MRRDVEQFFGEIERLLKLSANLVSISVDEESQDCVILENADLLFPRLLAHNSKITRVSIKASEFISYPGDPFWLVLSQLGNVKSYYDGFAFGLSKTTLRHFAHGWKFTLQTIRLNTEFWSFQELFPILQKFASLSSLEVTHFHQSILDNFGIFTDGLKSLKSLTSLGIDLQFTRHVDGLTSKQFGCILDTLPNLTHMTYRTSLDSYAWDEPDVQNEPSLDLDVTFDKIVLKEIAEQGRLSVPNSPRVPRLGTKRSQGYLLILEGIRELFAERCVELILDWD
ncbi:hypothetical protein HDU93_005694 [Gonapodya sp. JEL0774]|nr:hypothetical protein HDU93_005694 [Gonapodya sp. JEL0774]